MYVTLIFSLLTTSLFKWWLLSKNKQDLKKIAEKLPEEKKYIALLHDEMKVKADLVYDRRSQEVIGFTNPDTWSFNEVQIYFKNMYSSTGPYMN